ncbi:MAG: tetratricopeptide repeat protein [Alphaproteobacteria bacterium]|nr:tetratricopeptide repeat protein [Alphaproteobacteria bacterium]
MALTDPELDLLREMLEEDPADEVFLQVGEELVRRGDHAGAAEVLRQGLDAHPNEPDGWRFLTRAALECNRYDEALRAWDKAGDEHQADPDFARLRILALERAGRIDEARRAVDDFESRFDGFDVVVEAAKERMEAPPASDLLSAYDPFLNVRMAERYAAMGREDRAVRVYRRILFRHPDQIAIRARLEQLHGATSDLDDYTDLSEELADPNLVPPVFEMPMPGITSASVKPAPQRDAQPPAAARMPDADLPTPQLDEEDEGPSYTAPSYEPIAQAAVQREPEPEPVPEPDAVAVDAVEPSPAEAEPYDPYAEPATEEITLGLPREVTEEILAVFPVEETEEVLAALPDEEEVLAALPDEEEVLAALPAEEEVLAALPDEEEVLAALPAEEILAALPDEEEILAALPDEEEVLAGLPDEDDEDLIQTQLAEPEPVRRAVAPEEAITEIAAPPDLSDLSPARKKIPKALEQFMQGAREAERRAQESDDHEEEELEELPGLSEVGMTPRKRKKRRSLLKR